MLGSAPSVENKSVTRPSVVYPARVDELKRHVEQAVRHLLDNKLPYAAAEFEAAVRLAPSDVTLRQRLGDVYLRMGMRTHAVREYQQIAGRYAAEGMLLRAITICKVILELEPAHQETLRALADLYALQHETMPIVARLPKSMSGALPAANEAVTEPELDLESLKIFREALSGVHPLPPAANEDPADDTTAEMPPVTDKALPKLPPSPLFSSLDSASFQAVVQKLDLHWMTAGETIVQEGEQGDSMFVVVQGVVNVMHGDRVIAVMAEGSFFGEMALCTDSPRLATVVAARDGLLFEIDRAKVREISGRHPQVGKAIDEFYRDRLLANLLRASPVFRPLSEGDKAKVTERFVRHSLPPQTVMLEQGKPGAGFCVLLRGKCDVFHTDRTGENVPLPQLKEGDIFGEISLLLDGPCSATVRTASFCEVLELPRDDFQALVLPNPEVRDLVQRVVRERIERSADLLSRENRVLPSYTV
jgi:cAMP-dependent protein kinase regulator